MKIVEIPPAAPPEPEVQVTFTKAEWEFIKWAIARSDFRYTVNAGMALDFTTVAGKGDYTVIFNRGKALFK